LGRAEPSALGYAIKPNAARLGETIEATPLQMERLPVRGLDDMIHGDFLTLERLSVVEK